MLINVNIIQSPGILEGGPCCLTPNGSFVIPVGIERWVQVDEVHTGRVHAPQDGQVVNHPDGERGKVGTRYGEKGSRQRETQDSGDSLYAT